MTPEFIQVSSGEVCYLPDYIRIAQAQFPHHGGLILSGEREFRREFEQRIRDFVCANCTEAYQRYWKERQ
jgi:hypothetical protein